MVFLLAPYMHTTDFVVSFVIQELSLLFFFLQALDLLMSHFESSGCDKNNRSQSETQEHHENPQTCIFRFDDKVHNK
jgi:hypothetical protein